MPASRQSQSLPDAAPVPEYDAIIIGAGMSGMYQLYRLRELGMRVRVFETGTNVGRHLVLEPLSRRALQFRELQLRLLLFEGTPG